MDHSIVKRAIKKDKLRTNIVDIREYALNKHRQADDYPYGGGAGMLLSPEPIYLAFKSLKLQSNTKFIYTSPKGTRFNQAFATELSCEQELAILCGHYEGVDQRVIDMLITHEVSIGDYVLTGGELAAMVMVDAIARLIPGVINPKSLTEESFVSGFFEYPQYTRPYDFMGHTVPDVLLSGNHKAIAEWRNEHQIKFED